MNDIELQIAAEATKSRLAHQLLGFPAGTTKEGKQIPRMIDYYTVSIDSGDGVQRCQNVQFRAPRFDVLMAEFLDFAGSVYKFDPAATVEIRPDGRTLTIRSDTRTLEFERHKIPPRV
jgi:hypothetical protein